MATDKPRFSITLDEETMERIEVFQKKHGFTTKSRAIQALVEVGLKSYKVKAPGPKEPKAEDKFMKLYSRLPQEQKDLLLAIIRTLIQQG